MSVSLPTHTDIKARWARLGRPMSNPVVVIHRLPSAVPPPAPAADAQAAGVTSAPAAISLIKHKPGRLGQAAAKCCAKVGLTLVDVRSQRRELQITRARQICCYMLRRHMCAGFVNIARVLNLDHSTCVFAAKSIELRMAELEIDPKGSFDEVLRRIVEMPWGVNPNKRRPPKKYHTVARAQLDAKIAAMVRAGMSGTDIRTLLGMPYKDYNNARDRIRTRGGPFDPIFIGVTDA